jgi:hypothetical protein
MAYSAMYSARACGQLIVETRPIPLEIPMLLRASCPLSARLLPILFDHPETTERHTYNPPKVIALPRDHGRTLPT